MKLFRMSALVILCGTLSVAQLSWAKLADPCPHGQPGNCEPLGTKAPVVLVENPVDAKAAIDSLSALPAGTSIGVSKNYLRDERYQTSRDQLFKSIQAKNKNFRLRLVMHTGASADEAPGERVELQKKMDAVSAKYKISFEAKAVDSKKTVNMFGDPTPPEQYSFVKPNISKDYPL